MTQPLTIYIASAGAGKTHNLTLRYLALALQKDFSSIQAVTFTNKATEEMKERIVGELYKIAIEPLGSNEDKRSSVFFDDLVERLNLDLYTLQERARATLHHLLLNYNRFRVKTIDSFFQEVLRAFAREINLSGGFRLQLEADLALEAAVVGVLADQDEGSPKHRDAQEWIGILAKELILNGKGHNLKREILKLAQELQREPVKELSLAGKFPSPKSLSSFKTYLGEQDEALSALFIDLAQSTLHLLTQVGLSIQDTSYGASGGLSPINKLAAYQGTLKPLITKGFEPFSSRFLSLMTNPRSLFEKDPKGFCPDTKITELENLGLWHRLEEYKRLVVDVLPVLRSIYKVEGLLNSYGLIAEVDKKLKEQQRSANALLLADAPSLIHTILSDGSGVEFIYEKLGTRIEHQMIDEFQDTSELQYKNFLPLLEENIASGRENLIVGDLKQSIYRFRNSDSRILATQVQEDFSGQYEVEYLSQNWRSTPQIIEFNNFLFDHIPLALTEYYKAWITKIEDYNSVLHSDRAESLAQAFVTYYEAHKQDIPAPKRNRLGGVAIHQYTLEAVKDENEKEITEEQEEQEATLSKKQVPQSLPKVVIDLQRRGYQAKDIAILVRNKTEAQAVAEAMQSYTPDIPVEHPYSLEVISSEALRLDSSSSVRCLIAALRYIISPSSKQCEYLLREAYKQMSCEAVPSLSKSDLVQILEIGRLSLYEVVEGLFSLWRNVIEAGELPYQIKLLDMALNFQSDLSADISAFLTMWHERGSKQTLIVPEDKDKVRLMTVHKSKGLGFPVVLLPYPTWELIPSTESKRPILWCKNPLGMHEHIEQLPVRFSSDLDKTLFVNEYLEESVKMSLDALNLFYVATTRAKEELHLWLPDPNTSDKKAYKKYISKNSPLPKTILELLYPVVKMYKELETNALYWFNPDEAVAIDIEYKSKTEETHTAPLNIDRLHTYSVGARIEVLREGLEHFDPNNPRLYGRLMHSILSNIHTVEDVPLALLKAEQEGLFVGQDRRQYEKELVGWIERIEYPWFSPEVQVLREIPIIGKNIKTSRRPDRIILYPDGSVDVVDYKFGQKSEKYIQQVRTYQSLIQQMGYKVVRGYIWYVLQGEILAL